LRLMSAHYGMMMAPPVRAAEQQKRDTTSSNGVNMSIATKKP
jgi:hypothetical protein